MDFMSPASLGFYSSVKIASTLFCRQDLLYLEQKQLHLVGWVQVQDKVTQLVQSLQLPKNIEENVQELIQPIGDQIRRWLSKRAFVARGNVDLYNRFSWTSHGMINYRKTAENLINSKQLNQNTEFILACLDAVNNYAFFTTWEEHVDKRLWETNPITKLVHFPEGIDSKTKDEFNIMFYHLVAESSMEFKPSLVNLFKGAEFYEVAVKTMANNGNTSLTQHFMSKIEPLKKASLLRMLVRDILKSNNRFFNVDTLLFLLSQMNVDQINELLIDNPEVVLLRFLEWPLQRNFMKLANKLWGAMPPTTFNSVLQAIVQHIIQYCSISNNPFGYRDIFRDFWISSPTEYRRVSMNELIHPILFCLFRPHGCRNAVLKLFKDESYYEKLEILFFTNPDAVLEILSNENKAKGFKTIIQRYFSPNDIPLDFGEKYSVFTQKYLESYYGEIDIAD